MTSTTRSAALIRTIFTAPDGAQARRRLRDAIGQFERRLPKIAAMIEEAEHDVLAFYAFPAEHWTKLRSTNPLERVNREIGGRTDVVGIFPNDRSLIRLAGMLLIEQNDCHEGRQRRRRGGLSSPRRTLGAVRATASTRGGRRAVSRDRLGHPPRGLVFAHARG